MPKDYTQTTAVSNEATEGMIGGMNEQARLDIFDKMYTRFGTDDVVSDMVEKQSYPIVNGATTYTAIAAGSNIYNVKNSGEIIGTAIESPSDAQIKQYASIIFKAGTDISDTFLDDIITRTVGSIETTGTIFDIKRSKLYDGIDIDSTINISGIHPTEFTVYTDNTNTYKILPHIGKIYIGTVTVTDASTTITTTNKIYVIPKLGLIFVNWKMCDASTKTITLSAYENVSKLVYFCRLKNKKFNYSNNPTFLVDGLVRTPGNPITYVTTIGLYNDSNELLAIAKLSKPVKKSFNEELLIRTEIKY